MDRLAADRGYLAQGQTLERIDSVVVQLGLMSDAALIDALSAYFDLPIATPDIFPTTPVLPELFDTDFLKRCHLLPIEATDASVSIATSDPFATDSIAAVSYFADRPVKVYVGPAKPIEDAIDQLYGAPTPIEAVQDGTDGGTSAQEDDVQRLRDIASEAPIIRIVNRIIATAIAQRASDIHIEPAMDSIRVRHRVDGIMREVERLPPDLLSGIASRIKIIARLNIAERRLPQDGRTKFVAAGREIDLRVSTVPLMHGEKIVLRILDAESIKLDFSILGYDKTTQATLQSLLDAPNGIVLVTGPTGSGKTTTLYAALKALNSVERNVFTVEDPIEYQLPGINQMQTKPAIGLDFVQSLRSILRQDPDVVMIGEMRDTETARIAIQASLTGHLVLSTLHTNSAAASVTRMLDMGVEDYLLGSTLSAVLAQRLVRRLCTECAAEEPVDLETFAVLGEDMKAFAAALPHRRIKRPVGCPHCQHSGYHGRSAIYELLVVNDVIRKKLVRGVTSRDVLDAARESGMETLLQNGIRKVCNGETTLSEVLRVARV